MTRGCWTIFADRSEMARRRENDNVEHYLPRWLFVICRVPRRPNNIWSRTALQLGISIIISIVLMLILMLAGRIARMSWLLGQGLAQPWSRLCHFECFVSFGFLLMANLVVAPRDTAGPCKGSSPSPTDVDRSGNEPRGKYILVIFFFNSHTCMFWLDFWWQMHILVVGCSPLTCCSLFSEIWTTTQRSRNTDYIYYIYHYYYYYPARARARRACALRALGLLLADGAPTVGWGKTFRRVGRVPLTKTDVTRKRKVAQ